MDKIPFNIIESIKLLLDTLNKSDILIQKAILYGSYAKGNSDQYSDIDLALVSDSFSGNRFLDKEMIRRYVVGVNSDISPMPFRPEDFNRNNIFAQEIMKDGISIV